MAKALFLNSYAGGVNYPVGVTYYAGMGVTGSSAFAEGTETTFKVSLLSAGTLSKLTARIPTNGTGATSTIRTRKNAGNGNQSVSVGSGQTGTFQDLSNTDSISSGDDVNYQVVTGAGGTQMQLHIGCVFDATNATVMFSTTFLISTASVTRYIGLSTEAHSAAVTTESNVMIDTNYNNVWSGLSVAIKTNGRSTATTIRTRINSVNGNQSVSVTAGVTGIFEDTSNTDSFSGNNSLDYSITTGTGAGNLDSLALSSIIKSNDDYVLLGSSGDARASITSGNTFYYPIGGDDGRSSSEGNVNFPMLFGGKMTRLAAHITANGGGSPSTITVRQNGADTALQISQTSTGFFSDSDEITFATDDLIDVKVVANANITFTTLGVEVKEVASFLPKPFIMLQAVKRASFF